jgi:hypothetical protein
MIKQKSAEELNIKTKKAKGKIKTQTSHPDDFNKLKVER